jgi:hypothetical protein
MMANDSWDISIQVLEDTLHQHADSNHTEVCKVVSKSTTSNRNMIILCTSVGNLWFGASELLQALKIMQHTFNDGNVYNYKGTFCML